MIEYLDPDDVPAGWDSIVKAINSELREWYDMGKLREFHVVQLKEKYGELRLYYGTDCDNDGELSDVIEAYAYISSHTCAKCGEFPVPLTDDGWVLPRCRACYEKYRYRSRDYEDIVCGEQTFDPIMRMTRFSKDGKQEILIDVTPRLDRIKKGLRPRCMMTGKSS